MSTYYAQATANWNAANQWNTAANGSGSYGTPTTGDVCYANGFTVTINSSGISVGQIRTDAGSGTAGGGFKITATGYTFTGDCYAGTTTCLIVTAASGTTTLNSSGYGSTTTGSIAAIQLNAASTLNVTGNISAGSFSAASGISNTNATGTINITGNVTGGGASTAYGASNSFGGTITVSGNATGGTYVTAYGANNNSTGTVTVSGNAVSSSTTAGINGVASGGKTQVGGIDCSSGFSATAGYVTLIPGAGNFAKYLNSTTGTTTLVPSGGSSATPNVGIKTGGRL
jgi:hypothetical protein